MKNWGMKTAEEVFGFKYNDMPSTGTRALHVIRT